LASTIWQADDKIIRLHVWPSQNRHPQIPTWTVHSHNFDLDSHLLSGSLKNSLFDVSEDGAQTHCLYRVEYDGQESVLLRTDRHVLYERNDSTLQDEGQWYTVAREAFHASDVADDAFTATLALTVGRSARAPLVIGDLGGDSSYRYRREECDPTVLRSELSKLRSKLIANT
jgi:hypothetical protein